MCQRKHIHWTCGHYSIRHHPCPNPQPRARSRSCLSLLLGPRPCPVEDVLRIRDLLCRDCQERSDASRRRKAEKHTRRAEMAGQYRKFKAASKEAPADYGTLSGYQGVQAEEMVLQGGLAPPGAARVRGAERGVVPPPRLADRKFLEQGPRGPTKGPKKGSMKAQAKGPAKGLFPPGDPWEPVKPRGKTPSRVEFADVPLVLREEYVDVPLV